MKKLITIVGARPQFIKAAPVSRAISASGRLQEVILHSGQHFDDDMSKVFFDELGIPIPKYNLNIAGGGHGRMTGRMLEGMEAFLEKGKADAVLVYGDTNSTLAGALAAAKLQIPVVHVEAGLRSFNRAMPEETNRVVVDHVSDVLCAPTASAVRQLIKEGFNNVLADGALLECPLPVDVTRNINVPCVAWVGDVMLDALRIFGERSKEESDVLPRLKLKERGYVVVTIHRAENTSSPESVSSIFKELAALADQIPVVFPVHPRTRSAIESAGLAPLISRCGGLKLVPPLSYLDFLRLQSGARAIITDSGGIQKEAMFLGVPCITLRGDTEWPETVDAGWNRLVGANPKRLADMVANMSVPLTDTGHAFGRGNASEAIVALAEALVGC